MVYASIYLYLPQLLSSVFYSFLSTCLLSPRLNVFLDIYLFIAVANGIFFLVSLSDSSLLVYESAINFGVFCILLPHQIHLLCLVVF